MNTTWPVAQQLTSAPSRPSRVRGSAPRPDDHVIVVSGATGDLARRKLLPGLFHLAAAGLMPDRYLIIGSSRRSLADEQFRELARQAIAEFGTSKPKGAAWQAFQRRLSFASAEPGRTGSLAAVAPARRSEAEAKASRQHDENGRPYRSFRGLLAHLATLTRNQIRFAGTPAAAPVLTEPTSQQRQAFDLIGAPIPLALE